jgi:hypothetical protein
MARSWRPPERPNFGELPFYERLGECSYLLFVYVHSFSAEQAPSFGKSPAQHTSAECILQGCEVLPYPGMPLGDMLDHYRMLQCQLIESPFVAVHLLGNVLSPERRRLRPPAPRSRGCAVGFRSHRGPDHSSSRLAPSVPPFGSSRMHGTRSLHSLAPIGTDIQDRGYGLPRIPLPGTPLNSAVGLTRRTPLGGIMGQQDRRPERSARGRGR